MIDYDYKALVNEVTQRGIDLFGNFDDWTKGAQALSDLGEEGRPLFHSIASLADSYNKRENDLKFSNALRTTQKVSIATFIYMCNQAGINTKKFIIRDNEPKPATILAPIQRIANTKPKEICYISSELVKRSLDMRLKSNFQAFLCRIYNDTKKIQDVCLKYALGVTKDGSVIFWQIDEKGRVRSGKIMQYDWNGHRDKTGDQGKTDWIHNRMKKQGTLPQDWTLTQCLFGAHLLHPDFMNEGKVIGLVESEKSAILCSLVFPDYVWVSCGGISQLEAGGKHEVLKGRKVIMFPDTDPKGETFAKWKAKADEWNRLGLDVTVSDILEKRASDEEKSLKIDIADWLINDLKEKYIPSPIEYITEQTEQQKILKSMMQENLHLKKLVENLNLEIIY